jgi:hypothetical protein
MHREAFCDYPAARVMGGVLSRWVERWVRVGRNVGHGPQIGYLADRKCQVLEEIMFCRCLEF